MTTTAFDDQFAPEPVEPVRQPYDTAAILRRNVADAEKEMQRQAERAESYAEAMRSLASYVGAGGYNADTVDAGVFEEKIRWGIGVIQDRLAGAIERELVARTSLIEARNDIQTWIDSRNEWMKRAEAAESELEAVREDNHAMMLEIDGMRKELARLREQKPALYMAFSECGQFIRYWTRDTKNLDATMAVNDFTVLEFFAAPAPAPAETAPSVPEEWREVMTELADDLTMEIDQSYPPERRAYPSEQRKYEGEMAIVNRAHALLQSADHSERNLEKVAPDCRACANRGLVNGLSQESYCDGCVYQGRSWRKNHFVLAVKRRCEACAILPCSCK